MTITDNDLFESLYDLASDLDLNFFDVRTVLPTNPGKTYSRRSLGGILSTCYHHQADDPSVSPGFLDSRPDVKGVLNANGSLWTSDDYLGAVFRIAEYHIGPDSPLEDDGAPGIAYTLAVDPAGGVYFCNDIGARTWSQRHHLPSGDKDAEFLAVLFMGNLVSAENPGGHPPTPAQMMVAAAMWERVYPNVGLDPAQATTHNRLGRPACPGDHITSVVDCVRASGGGASAHSLDTWPERQKALNQVLDPSPGLVEDGIYGPATKSAIVRFQTDEGLTADGAWGPDTEAAMQKRL